MMTVSKLTTLPGFTLLSSGEDMDREIQSVYCCDLLSIAMGRAPKDSAWVTVMANVNAVAVALLADVGCIVLAEGMALDEEALQKACERRITVLTTDLPIFEAAKAIDTQL